MTDLLRSGVSIVARRDSDVCFMDFLKTSGGFDSLQISSPPFLVENTSQRVPSEEQNLFCRFHKSSRTVCGKESGLCSPIQEAADFYLKTPPTELILVPERPSITKLEQRRFQDVETSQLK